MVSIVAMKEKNSLGASFSAWTRPVSPLPTELFFLRVVRFGGRVPEVVFEFGYVAESRLSFLAPWDFSIFEILASISLIDIVVIIESSYTNTPKLAKMIIWKI